MRQNVNHQQRNLQPEVKEAEVAHKYLYFRVDGEPRPRQPKKIELRVKMKPFSKNNLLSLPREHFYLKNKTKNRGRDRKVSKHMAF